MMKKSGKHLRRLVLRAVITAGAALSVFAPSVAFAQQDPYPTVPTTPTTVECTPGDTSVVCGTVVTVPDGGGSSSSLAFTGGDSAVLAALGVGAIGSGALILFFSRRRSTSPAA